MRAIEVKKNPRGEVAKARAQFEKWHEFKSGHVSRIHGPKRLPKVVAKLGELVSLSYRSNKYAGGPDNPKGKTITYEHQTKRPRPVLVTDPDGRDVFIVGGNMKVTADGLEN